MKRLAFFIVGGVCGAFALISLARLRQFMLEPDYIMRNNTVRCDGGAKP